MEELNQRENGVQDAVPDFAIPEKRSEKKTLPNNYDLVANA